MASLVPGLDGTAAEGAVTVSAPSAILLEAQTGTVIFEKDADRICSPASITKIMTLLLIFEALGQGQIHLTDEVVTSEHAQSMGGSQVFLEAGEVQTGGNADQMYCGCKQQLTQPSCDGGIRLRKRRSLCYKDE